MPPHLLAVLRGRGLLVLQRRPRLALRLLHRRHVLPVLARGPQVPVQLGGGLQHAKSNRSAGAECNKIAGASRCTWFTTGGHAIPSMREQQQQQQASASRQHPAVRHAASHPGELLAQLVPLRLRLCQLVLRAAQAQLQAEGQDGQCSGMQPLSQ